MIGSYVISTGKSEDLEEVLEKDRKNVKLRMDIQHPIEEEQEDLVGLLVKYRHLWKNKIRGRVKGYSHAVYLKHYISIVSRPRYCSETKREVIIKEME